MSDALRAFADFFAAHSAAAPSLALIAILALACRRGARAASRSRAARSERRRMATILDEQGMCEWIGGGDFAHPAYREAQLAILAQAEAARDAGRGEAVGA